MAIFYVEIPICVAGHGATVTLKNFWMLEEVGWQGDVVAWEFKRKWYRTRIRQAYSYGLLTCLSQTAPVFSQAGIEGPVVNVWHLTGVKVLREAGECLSLGEEKEMGQTGFFTSCRCHDMAGAMEEQLEAACLSFPT